MFLQKPHHWMTLGILFAASLVAKPTLSAVAPPNAEVSTPVEVSPPAVDLALGDRTPRQIYDQTLPAVALLVGERDGQLWHGTGWILDLERRLIVTNQHVVERFATVDVYFPEFENGRVRTETRDFFERNQPVTGQVIDSDITVDLALIQVAALPEHAIALPLAKTSASPGDRVHAIGGGPRNSIGLWKYSIGYVNLISESTLATGYPTRVMQSNIDTQEGNSGGPIVNDQGELVAVVEGGNREDHRVSINIDVPVVRSYAEQIVSLLDADTETSLIELGRRNLRERRPATAIHFVSRAIQHNPQSAEAYVVRGDAFFTMQDFQTALTDYSEAIEIKASFAEAWYGRSRAHAFMELYEEAFTDISKAIRYNPLRATFYNYRGLVQWDRGEHDLALGDLTRATELEQETVQFHKDRGRLLRAMQRSQEAIESFKQAVQLAPYDAVARNLLGLGYYDLGEYDQAAELFYDAFELDQTNPLFAANFGEAMQGSRRDDRFKWAVDAFGAAIELDSRNDAYYYERAWSLRQLQRYQDAWQDINMAISLNGTVAHYYAERAEILNAVGEADRAQQDRQKASELDPETYPTATPSPTPPSPTTASPTAPASDQPALVGQWYVNQVVNGQRMQAWQTYFADGRYQATHKYFDQNGQQVTETEQGTFVRGETEIEFNTNYGHYFQKYQFQDDMLYLYVNDVHVWIGSVRQ